MRPRDTIDCPESAVDAASVFDVCGCGWGVASAVEDATGGSIACGGGPGTAAVAAIVDSLSVCCNVTSCTTSESSIKYARSHDKAVLTGFWSRLGFFNAQQW